MVMVERGQVDPNRLLVAAGSVTQGGFAEAGCSWPSRHLGPWVLGQPVSCHTAPHLHPPLWETKTEKKVIFLALWHPRVRSSTLRHSSSQSFPVNLSNWILGVFQEK